MPQLNAIINDRPEEKLIASIITAFTGDPVGVVRTTNDGEVWLMNRKDQGWSSFGYCSKTFDDLERKFANDGLVFMFHLADHDSHGLYIPYVFINLDGF